MISTKLEKALNKQIELEAAASFKYLAMSSWCEKEGLKGAAQFFMRQSDEERQHMLKVFTYINDVGGHAIVPAAAKPQAEYKSIQDTIQSALAGEKLVTKSVHQLVELAEKEKDYATYNFLQFFVNEQQEEEVLYQEVLDKINLIGLEGMGLYYIDKELETLKPVAGPIA